MDSFTGIDVDRAIADINSFLEEAGKIHGKLRTCNRMLFTNLAVKWASPNAKSFTDSYVPKYQDLDHDFEVYYLHIVHGAIDAAVNLCAANGKKLSNPFDTTTSTLDCSNWFCSESLDGEIGMDTQGVKFILDDYYTSMTQCVLQLDSLPKGIAFYDPANNLVETYGRNVDKFKDLFKDLITSIQTELKNYIETETDNIVFAKNKAQSILESRVAS